MELFIVLSVMLLAGGVGLGLLLLRGTLLVGDRRAIDRLAAQLAAELHIQAHTQATLRAMHEAACRASRTPSSRP